MFAEQETRRAEALARETTRQTQVHLVVLATVEVGIERAGFSVAARAHEHGLLLHEVQFEHAQEDLVLGHVRHLRATPVLDATVRMAEDDRVGGVDEARLGMGLENRQVTFEVLRQGDVVVVEDPQILAAHLRHRPIERARLAAILLIDHLDALAVALEDSVRRVRRAVVDHDNLGGRHGLPQDAVEGLAEVVRPIEGRDHGGDVRSAHFDQRTRKPVFLPASNG